MNFYPYLSHCHLPIFLFLLPIFAGSADPLPSSLFLLTGDCWWLLAPDWSLFILFLAASVCGCGCGCWYGHLCIYLLYLPLFLSQSLTQFSSFFGTHFWWHWSLAVLFLLLKDRLLEGASSQLITGNNVQPISCILIPSICVWVWVFIYSYLYLFIISYNVIILYLLGVCLRED